MEIFLKKFVLGFRNKSARVLRLLRTVILDRKSSTRLGAGRFGSGIYLDLYRLQRFLIRNDRLFLTFLGRSPICQIFLKCRNLKFRSAKFLLSGMTVSNDSKGFTLAEVLISMTVLALTFAAAVGLLLSSIQANRANRNDFIAYELAQEGLEAMRNIRDSHWMQNFSWTGTNGTWKDAGSYFGEVIFSSEERFYRLSYNFDYEADTGTALASKYNPWVFEDLGGNFLAIAPADLLLYTLDCGGSAVFGHDVSLGSCTDEGESIFSRYIEVRPVIEGSVDMNRVKVLSVVFWNEKGRDRKIELSTVLTNWKGGVL